MISEIAMTGLELEFKGFLQEFESMIESTLWVLEDNPELAKKNLDGMIRTVREKIKELV